MASLPSWGFGEGFNLTRVFAPAWRVVGFAGSARFEGTELSSAGRRGTFFFAERLYTKRSMKSDSLLRSTGTV